MQHTLSCVQPVGGHGDTVDPLTRQRWVDPLPVRSYLAELRRRQSTRMNSRTELGSNLKEYIGDLVIRVHPVNPLSLVNVAATALPHFRSVTTRKVRMPCRLQPQSKCDIMTLELRTNEPVHAIGRLWQKSRCSLFFTWERWQWRGAQQEEATQLSPATNRLLRKKKARH